MTTEIIVQKRMTLYVAYAPEFDMGAVGKCWEEAFGCLADEIQQRGSATATGEERKSQR